MLFCINEDAVNDVQCCERDVHTLWLLFICLNLFAIFQPFYPSTYTHFAWMIHKFMEYVVVVVAFFFLFLFYIFFLWRMCCVVSLVFIYFLLLYVCVVQYLFRVFGFICPFTEITQIEEVIIIMNRVSNARLFQ